MTNFSEKDLFYLKKSMKIAFDDQTLPDIRLAAEAVASAILNGASGNSLHLESIAILIKDNLYSAVPYVDEILDLTSDNCN